MIAGAAVWLCTGLCGFARAQVAAIGGYSGPQLQAPPLPGRGEDVFALPARPENALPFGEWLVYPSDFAGAIYDTNPDQNARGQASPGFELTPAILAQRDTGINKTTLYGMADGRLYTNPTTGAANSVFGQLGGSEEYRPLPDWRFNAQANYTRQQNVFSTLALTHSVTTLNPTGVGLLPSVNQPTYNQFSGSASVDKQFSTAFVDVGGSAVSIAYDSSGSLRAPSPNGAVYTGTGRGGIWLTPDFYSYLEYSGDSRSYATAALSSSGYLAAAGIGSRRIGLFRGEFYFGYQAETYSSAAIGTIGGPAFGGHAYYYPLPELTLSLGVDRTIGVSALVATPTSPLGTATQVTDVLAQAVYSLGPEWTASGSGGYALEDYLGSTRRDNAWTIGTTVTYSVWRNLGISCNYQHLELNSTVPSATFSRDVVSVGLSYRY